MLEDITDDVIREIEKRFAVRAERMLRNTSKHQPCTCGKTGEDESLHRINCPVQVGRECARAVRLFADF